jgi:hypothetical protein
MVVCSGIVVTSFFEVLKRLAPTDTDERHGHSEVLFAVPGRPPGRAI